MSDIEDGIVFSAADLHAHSPALQVGPFLLHPLDRDALAELRDLADMLLDFIDAQGLHW